MPTDTPGRGPGRDPSTGPPFASLRRTPDGGYELTVTPGADPSDLNRALAAVPADAVFTEHFGDVAVALVFRTATAPPAASPATPEPTGWAPGAAARPGGHPGVPSAPAALELAVA
jgi:uncharacterized repeat protein (TIGR03917 family)